MQAFSVRGGGFGVGNGLTERGGKAIAAADDAKAYAFLDAVGGFGQEILVEDAQNPAHFGGGALPIGGGESVKCESVNAEAWCSLNDGTSGLRAGTVAGGTRETAGGGPAAVAVGDDGDMKGARWWKFGTDWQGLRGKDWGRGHGLGLFSAARKRYKLLCITK